MDMIAYRTDKNLGFASVDGKEISLGCQGDFVPWGDKAYRLGKKIGRGWS
jgi:hypothetical protein